MHPNEEFPRSVGLLVDGCIDSVEALSVLLLLHGSPAREWSIEEINRELRSTPSSIRIRLEDLYRRKVLMHSLADSSKHQYLPFSPEIRDAVDQLAHLYRAKPYRVIERIYSRPTRIIAEFAEAFRIRKDE